MATLSEIEAEETVKKILLIVKEHNKDPKKLDEETEMTSKRFKLENMTPEDIKDLLIEEPQFALTPELERCRLRDHGPIILKRMAEALYRLRT